MNQELLDSLVGDEKRQSSMLEELKRRQTMAQQAILEKEALLEQLNKELGNSASAYSSGVPHDSYNSGSYRGAIGSDNGVDRDGYKSSDQDFGSGR